MRDWPFSVVGGRSRTAGRLRHSSLLAIALSLLFVAAVVAGAWSFLVADGCGPPMSYGGLVPQPSLSAAGFHFYFGADTDGKGARVAVLPPGRC